VGRQLLFGRSRKCAVLSRLVARQERGRKQNDDENVQGVVHLNPNRCRSVGLLGNKRRKSSDNSERLLSLSGSKGSYRSSDEEEKRRQNTVHKMVVLVVEACTPTNCKSL